jgi:hypothetical protein
MIRTALPAVALFALIALIPANSARAQTADVKSVVLNAASTADGLSARQVGISRATLVEHTRQVETTPAGATDALAQARARRGMPLMVVGGAAFIAGLIIGDDAGTAIAVGGAVIGLYGLYLWAQTQ